MRWMIGQAIRKLPFPYVELFGHPSDPNTTSSSLRHHPQCSSFKNLHQGCVSRRLLPWSTRVAVADVVILGI